MIFFTFVHFYQVEIHRLISDNAYITKQDKKPHINKSFFIIKVTGFNKNI